MHDQDEADSPCIGKISQSGMLHTQSPQDASLEPLLEEIRQKHGAALLAVLVYGSWLRGKRDTMLDFYVLVEDYRTLDSPRCAHPGF